MKNKWLCMMLTLLCSLSAMAGDSLYESGMKWKNELGATFTMAELRGKKVIVAMAYTRCQIMCPMIISKVKKYEDTFIKKNIPVEVVIITFDPAFDTPQRTQEFYRQQMNIKGKNWHFLTGTDGQTRMMSMLLGIKYSVNPKSKIIMHDNKLILLDESGAIEKRYESLDELQLEQAEQ